MKVKKLYRSREDKVIAGVAGGLGKYFEVDSDIVRILFVVVCLAGGSAILLYIIICFLVPLEPERNTQGARIA